jgi:hypothetical protein
LLFAGAYGQTPSQAAAVLFDTVAKFFSGNKQRTLQELHVVMFDVKMIPQFVGAFEAKGSRFVSENTGFVNWFKSSMF